MRNEWKFSLLEMIDRESIPKVKMATILDRLELYKKNPTSKYPYLYLLKRAVEEVSKRDWITRDKELKNSYDFLKEKVIDMNFWDEDKDRKIFESGVCGYFVESPGFGEMFEKFVRGINRFKKEW